MAPDAVESFVVEDFVLDDGPFTGDRRRLVAVEPERHIFPVAPERRVFSVEPEMWIFPVVGGR